jgi:hypothetical protein
MRGITIDKISTPIAKSSSTESGQRYARSDPPVEPTIAVTVGIKAVAVAIGPPGTGVLVRPAITATVAVAVAVGSTAGGTGVVVGARVAVSVGSADTVRVVAGVVVSDWVTSLVAATVGVCTEAEVGVQVGVPGPTGL